MHTAFLGAVGDQGGVELPTWTFIAKFVSDGTSSVYDFTSIPQTYRDLRLVGSLARNAVYPDKLFIYIDVGSGIDTTVGNYGFLQIAGDSSAYGSLSNNFWSGGQAGFSGDWPSGIATEQANSVIMDFHDYANSSKIATAILWQNAFKAGTTGYSHSHGGWMYEPTGAIEGIRVTNEAVTSNYYFIAPTTFALFGRGTAD